MSRTSPPLNDQAGDPEPPVEETPVPDHELPPHWVFKREGHPLNHSYFCWRPFPHFLCHLFCLIGFGHVNLDGVWEVCHPDCAVETWERWRDQLKGRLQHINVMAGLILTAMTAYATTDPPANSRILPYTKTAPYVLVTISVALALQCIVIGSASLLVLHNATARWCREIMMGSRPRVWTTMMLISVPPLAVLSSAGTAGCGLLVAVAHSKIAFFRILSYFFLVPVLFCLFGFFWMVCLTPETL